MQEKNRDFSIIKEKILQYLDSKGISKYEVYQKTGITNGVFSQSNGISEENILKFLNYYRDISTDWLFVNYGPMLKNPDLMTSEDMDQHDREVDEGKWHHSSKSDKDFSETEHQNTIINAMAKEITDLKSRLSEYADRISEQKETISAQKELILLLKKAAPKTQQCTTDKSTTKV